MKRYKFIFSPTGGTKQVAAAIEEGWGEPFQPIDLMKPTEKRYFQSEDQCLFAVPSYGGRIPTVVVERIRELSGNGALAILIAVFGNRAIDDTLLELSDELQQAGFRCVAAMEAVAQHSLLPQFGAGRPDAADVEELHGFGKRIREVVEAGSWSAELKLPGNRPYKAYKGVPLKPSVSSGCIGCGRCVEQCPVGAIPVLNCRATDTRKCISCMHCVQICPKHVRKVSKVLTFVAGQAMKKTCTERKPNKLYL